MGEAAGPAAAERQAMLGPEVRTDGRKEADMISVGAGFAFMPQP